MCGPLACLQVFRVNAAAPCLLVQQLAGLLTKSRVTPYVINVHAREGARRPQLACPDVPEHLSAHSGGGPPGLAFLHSRRFHRSKLAAPMVARTSGRLARAAYDQLIRLHYQHPALRRPVPVPQERQAHTHQYGQSRCRHADQVSQERQASHRGGPAGSGARLRPRVSRPAGGTPALPPDLATRPLRCCYRACRWISVDEYYKEARPWQVPPLDETDGAARVLYPLMMGLKYSCGKTRRHFTQLSY